MYLLDVDSSGFRFFPYLILPVLGIAVIALGLFFLRHRLGKGRG
jgi:hypothetical protein